MTDNEYLALIQGDVASIKDAVVQEYSSISSVSGTAQVATPFTRAADDAAVKTLITNNGPNPIQIKEGGAVVALVDVFNTWESPTQGKLALEARTLVDTSSVTISTYK